MSANNSMPDGKRHFPGSKFIQMPCKSEKLVLAQVIMNESNKQKLDRLLSVSLYLPR